MKLFIGVFFLFIFNFGQSQIVLDTAELDFGKIVIYSDQSWQLIEDKDFDGILNPRIHSIMNSEEMGTHLLTWNTHDCYTRNNDLTKLKDTVWLCAESMNLVDLPCLMMVL